MPVKADVPTIHPGLVEAAPVVGRAKQIQPLAVGLQDAARLLGISDTHFESHVAPTIGCVKIGKRKLYRVASLKRWLAEHEQGGLGSAGDE
jgi:hypothetical protein